MRSVALALLFAVRDLLRSRAAPQAEIIALRHQVFLDGRRACDRVPCQLLPRFIRAEPPREGARLAHQAPDDVAIIEAVIGLAPESRHRFDDLAAVQALHRRRQFL